MPAPTNLSFETLGPRAGMADKWVHRSQTRTFIAGFARNAFLSGGLSSPMALDSADWTPVQLTVTANAEDDPDGGMTAERLTDNGVNALHYLQRTSGIALENGKAYTFGFFARKSILGTGIDKVGAYFDLGGGNYAFSCFDIFGASDARKVANLFITAGALPTITKIHGEVSNFSIGGGGEVWCLCATTILIAGTPTIAPAIILNPNNSGALTTYAGTSQALDAWGAFFIEDALDPEDSFERAWSNDNYLFTMTLGVHTILFSLPSLPFPDTKNEEDFEELWDNSPYLTILALNPGDFITFDEPNDETAEDFEEDWSLGLEHSRTFTTIHQDNKLFTTTAHGFISGTRLMVSSTVQLPTGLVANQVYFVANAGVADFQLSLTNGGTAIDLTDDGLGVHTLTRVFPTSATAFTVNTASDLITVVSHGFLGGELIQFISTSVLPQPIVPSKQYIVGFDDVDTFFLLEVDTLAVVNITDTGTGTHYIERVTYRFAEGEAIEDFEESWSLGLLIQRNCTATAGTDEINLANHALFIGNMLQFFVAGLDVLPTPLQPETPYWVVEVPTSGTFKVSASPGGTVIDLTSSGGSFIMRRYFPSPLTYTTTPATDEFNVTAHPFLVGTRFHIDTTSTHPTPLTPDTNYYIISRTANAFVASATRNGAAVNIIGTGIGTQFIARVFANFYDHTPDTFGVPASDVEDFETTRRPRQYTVDFTTDTFASNAHGYSTNDVIFFTNDGGAVPGGINVTTPYFIIGATANTFQVSLTQGGGAVNITDNGSGLQFFNGDPKRYWIEFNDFI